MTPEDAGGCRRLVVDSTALPWSASPADGVWRKRLYHRGPVESGQVTSLVRYGAGAGFPEHDHPDGEEILVLSGTFADEHGRYPAGTYLLNPDGFRHRPVSPEGCLLFVRLRQHPGHGRNPVRVHAGKLPWRGGRGPNVSVRLLAEQEGFPQRSRLELWLGGHEGQRASYPAGSEILVLEGSLADDFGSYPAGSWLRFAAGESHRPWSAAGCLLYIQEGLDSQVGQIAASPA